jgi:cobalt-zinc-cadmium efflux system protein
MTMAHDHDHEARGNSGWRNRKPLAITLALVAVTMIGELVGGLVSNSLALLADAGHMLTDVCALGLSLFAIGAARRPATATRTYGFYRLEILAALLNGATLIAMSIWIFAEACRRWARPPAVNGGLMLGIATGGLVVNLTALWILRHGRKEGLNQWGAWLHVFSDTLGSVQVIVAGVLIGWLGWNWADPLASILIGCLVMYSSWGLLKESVAVLMEGTPGNLDLDEVRAAIGGVPGVTAVHDLHVWTITSGFVALSAHVLVRFDCPEDVLWRVRDLLRDRFGIGYSTIQVERQPGPQGISF